MWYRRYPFDRVWKQTCLRSVKKERKGIEKDHLKDPENCLYMPSHFINFPYRIFTEGCLRIAPQWPANSKKLCRPSKHACATNILLWNCQNCLRHFKPRKLEILRKWPQASRWNVSYLADVKIVRRKKLAPSVTATIIYAITNHVPK
jgi:hypothetical protein